MHATEARAIRGFAPPSAGHRSLAPRCNPPGRVTFIERVPSDFRDGKTFPRRGRQKLGEALWLLRVSDKARANDAGTIHDYIYPCPMDQGMLQRWGVTQREFEEALRRNATDELLYQWFVERVSPERVRDANEWLLTERIENLDRQDAEEMPSVQHT